MVSEQFRHRPEPDRIVDRNVWECVRRIGRSVGDKITIVVVHDLGARRIKEPGERVEHCLPFLRLLQSDFGIVESKYTSGYQCCFEPDAAEYRSDRCRPRRVRCQMVRRRTFCHRRCQRYGILRQRWWRAVHYRLIRIVGALARWLGRRSRWNGVALRRVFCKHTKLFAGEWPTEVRHGPSTREHTWLGLPAAMQYKLALGQAADGGGQEVDVHATRSRTHPFEEAITVAFGL